MLYVLRAFHVIPLLYINILTYQIPPRACIYYDLKIKDEHRLIFYSVNNSNENKKRSKTKHHKHK